MTLALPQGNWVGTGGAPLQAFHQWADQVDRETQAVRDLIGNIQLPDIDPGDGEDGISDLVSLVDAQTVLIGELQTEMDAINQRLDALPNLQFYEEQFDDDRQEHTINHNLGTEQIVWAIDLTPTGTFTVDTILQQVIDENNLLIDMGQAGGVGSTPWKIKIMGLV